MALGQSSGLLNSLMIPKAQEWLAVGESVVSFHSLPRRDATRYSP